MAQIARSPVAIIVLVLLATLAGGCGGGGGGSATRPATGMPPPVPDLPPAPIQDIFEPVPTYESDYEALFSLDSMKTIHIRISEEEWNSLLNDVDHNIRAEVSRRADFFFGDDVATAQFVPGVGFRIRGNSFSRKRPEAGGGLHNPAATLVRAHFKIKFNEQFDEDEPVIRYS